MSTASLDTFGESTTPGSRHFGRGEQHSAAVVRLARTGRLSRLSLAEYAKEGGTVRTDEEVSAQNPPQDASRAPSWDRRFFLLFLFLLIAVYAVIAYGVYQVIDALA